MRTIRVIASSVGVLFALVATFVAVKSVPDVQHYRRLRNM
jgi:hypothetical protein